MYEEESHYYVDVLCDEFCEIANNNEIVYFEDQNTEQSAATDPSPMKFGTEEGTDEKSYESKKKKELTDK